MGHRKQSTEGRRGNFYNLPVGMITSWWPQEGKPENKGQYAENPEQTERALVSDDVSEL